MTHSRGGGVRGRVKEGAGVVYRELGDYNEECRVLG